MSNPCTDKLTDLEYLIHMIPHHQVAVDISKILMEKTKDPNMLYLCRQIIRKQEYEIWEMTLMKNNKLYNINNNHEFIQDNLKTNLEKYYPKLSKSKNGDCNPLFFKPDEHMKHMEHMEVNEKMFLEHMIPHHQVAVDMSKRLLLHTTNSYLIDFCRDLIIAQQGEIFYMNNLLNNKLTYRSNIF